MTTPAHDPWNRTADTVSMHSEGSVIEFGGTQPAPADPPAAPRRRHRAVFIAASTAAVVLIGAGAYAGVRAWTGSGNVEPETVMPATATAFARIDLNPGVRDKLAFDNLAKKFPTKGRSTTDLVTQLEAKAAKSAGLDYTTDVKPWFDGRIGVAAWADASGHPVALVALASKDDAKARATLTKVQSDKGGPAKFGFVLKGGYALVTLGDAGAQTDATAAATEAATHNLADNAAFKDTTGKTGSNNLLLAYADLHALGRLAPKSLGTGAIPGFGGSSGFGTAAAALTGTFAIGGRVTDDGIEIQGHAQGLDPKATLGGADVRTALGALPSNSVVALATAGLDPASDAAKHLIPMLDGLLSNGGGLGAGLGTPNPQVKGMLNQLSPILRKVLTAKVISVALTAVSPTPALSLNVQARSTADAAAILTPIQQLLGGAAGLLALKQDGDTVRAGFGPAGSGHLADSPLYRKAMAGMGNAQFAAFVDLQALLKASPKDQAVTSPLRAAGLYLHTTGSTADFMTRVIITK